MVLEEAGDESLIDYVAAKGPLNLRVVKDLARQLVSAVGHLHKHNVCHRDLKPDNVLVTASSDGEMRLKLIDFNVAVDLAECPSIRGKTGVDAWSAPETRKWVSYDEKCDMWSVGLLITFMVTGKQPKSGNQSDSLIDATLSDSRFDTT